MASGAGTHKPRLLVTGFGAFPGAPVNPTELLVAEIEARRGKLSAVCDLQTAVFDVDYRALPSRLDAIAAEGCPDIAVHFGFAATARGFRLERAARNEIRPHAPDSAGHQPDCATICDDGGAVHPSTLPLAAIEVALRARGMAVEHSDYAGGYLCNFLFYHACGGLRPAYAPQMAGFIHVPSLRSADALTGMTIEDLADGAIAIMTACIAAWHAACQT